MLSDPHPPSSPSSPSAADSSTPTGLEALKESMSTSESLSAANPRDLSESLATVALPPAAESLSLPADDLSLDRMTELISEDADLAEVVIQIANSAAVGLSYPVRQLRHAVAVLGSIKIREIALRHRRTDATHPPAPRPHAVQPLPPPRRQNAP